MSVSFGKQIFYHTRKKYCWNRLRNGLSFSFFPELLLVFPDLVLWHTCYFHSSQCRKVFPTCTFDRVTLVFVSRWFNCSLLSFTPSYYSVTLIPHMTPTCSCVYRTSITTEYFLKCTLPYYTLINLYLVTSLQVILKDSTTFIRYKDHRS